MEGVGKYYDGNVFKFCIKKVKLNTTKEDLCALIL